MSARIFFAGNRAASRRACRCFRPRRRHNGHRRRYRATIAHEKWLARADRRRFLESDRYVTSGAALIERLWRPVIADSRLEEVRTFVQFYRNVVLTLTPARP